MIFSHSSDLFHDWGMLLFAWTTIIAIYRSEQQTRVLLRTSEDSSHFSLAFQRFMVDSSAVLAFCTPTQPCTDIVLFFCFCFVIFGSPVNLLLHSQTEHLRQEVQCYMQILRWWIIFHRVQKRCACKKAQQHGVNPPETSSTKPTLGTFYFAVRELNMEDDLQVTLFIVLFLTFWHFSYLLCEAAMYNTQCLFLLMATFSYRFFKHAQGLDRNVQWRES